MNSAVFVGDTKALGNSCVCDGKLVPSGVGIVGFQAEDAARSLSEIFVNIAVLVVRLFSVTRMISASISSVTESSLQVAGALLVWLFLNVLKLQYSLPRSALRTDS